jgi:hypothetical protein
LCGLCNLGRLFKTVRSGTVPDQISSGRYGIDAVLSKRWF